MTKNVLILGGYGQIGNAIYEKIRNSQNVYRTNTKNLQLGNSDDYYNLTKLIAEIKPNLIINCIGIFDGNNADLENMLNINVRPSWYIIRIINALSPKNKIDY